LDSDEPQVIHTKANLVIAAFSPSRENSYVYNYFPATRPVTNFLFDFETLREKLAIGHRRFHTYTYIRR